jgi:DNA (cytosine-5)-methyltransferase 1
MTHGSLFSGIGGFDLAAHWMGWDNIFHCEWNEFGQKVLKHHFPTSKSYNDITKTDFSIHRGEIDILTGGFPCQPYSTAGLRKGKADERHLFPEMLRAIQEIKPRWIIGENVRGLVSWGGGLVFEEVCSDLEREGYEVQSFLIPAASVNAPHQRQRIWFVAYSNDKRGGTKSRQISKENGEISEWNKDAELSDTDKLYATNTTSIGLCEHSKRERLQFKTFRTQFGLDKKIATNTKDIGQEYALENRELERGRFRKSYQRNTWDSFASKSPVCGGDDGIPRELDSITFPKWRNESIKGYGNAIVPQVAFELFKTIELFENV